jgi:hypothetical protein
VAGADFDEVAAVIATAADAMKSIHSPATLLPTVFLKYRAVNGIHCSPIRRIDADFTAIAGAVLFVDVDHVIYPELDGEIAAKHKNTMTPVVMSNLMADKMAAHTADIA